MMICNYYVEVKVVLQFAVCVCLGDEQAECFIVHEKKCPLLRGVLLCEVHQNKFNSQPKLPWLKTREETIESFLGGDPTLLCYFPTTEKSLTDHSEKLSVFFSLFFSFFCIVLTVKGF